MPRIPSAPMLAILSLLSCGVSAFAETLRCQSVNGNLNCAGSSGASCQTVDGKTTCTSGHGDVIQSFGGTHTKVPDNDVNDPDWNELPPVPNANQWLQRHDHSMLPDRDGTLLHRNTDWLSPDRD